MQCAFEETSFSLESWTDSAFLIFSVVGIEVGLIVTFLNQVCKNSCDSVLFADFVSSTTTASLCRRCWSFQSEMWKCSAQADRCLFSKQLRLFREFGSSWLCVYYPWSFSFRWSDPNLKRDWLVFVGSSFMVPCRAFISFVKQDWLKKHNTWDTLHSFDTWMFWRTDWASTGSEPPFRVHCLQLGLACYHFTVDRGYHGLQDTASSQDTHPRDSKRLWTQSLRWTSMTKWYPSCVSCGDS